MGVVEVPGRVSSSVAQYAAGSLRFDESSVLAFADALLGRMASGGFAAEVRRSLEMDGFNVSRVRWDVEDVWYQLHGSVGVINVTGRLVFEGDGGVFALRLRLAAPFTLRFGGVEVLGAEEASV